MRHIIVLSYVSLYWGDNQDHNDCVFGFAGCSVWVMMNKQTRRLSKIPEEVRGEIEPYFMGSAPVVEEDSRKLQKLDDNTADYVRSGLTVS